jgi:hypothetical protein
MTSLVEEATSTSKVPTTSDVIGGGSSFFPKKSKQPVTSLVEEAAFVSKSTNDNQ